VSLAGVQRSVPLVATVVSGLGISLFVKPPMVWFLGLSLLAVAATVAQRVVHFDEMSGTRIGPSPKDTRAVWILPCLVAGASFVWLQQPVFSTFPWVGVLLTFAGAVLMGVVTLQSLAASDEERHRNAGRAGLFWITYITAFALYTLIYITKIRSLFTATAVLIVTVFVTIELLKDSDLPPRQNTIYAGAVGLVLGEATWVFNYWVVNAFMGGALLVLVLYVAVGIVQTQAADKLTRRALMEYGVIALVGLGLAVGSMFLGGEFLARKLQ